MEGLIRILASTRADKAPGRQRQEWMNTVSGSLTALAADREALANMDDVRCWSSFGTRRLATLYCTALRAETERAGVRKLLGKRLCSLLESSAAEHQAETARILKHCRTSQLSLTAEGTKPAEQKAALTAMFSEISAEEKSLAALALLPETDWDLFMTIAVSGDTIASEAVVEGCCSQTIAERLDADSWEQIVGPGLLQKLKAKPEAVIGMVRGLTGHLAPSVVASSPLVVGEFLTVVLKHAKSPKDGVRQPAAGILKNLGCSAVGDKDCLGKIVVAVADTKSLTQMQQREAVYGVFRKIGDAALEQKAELDAGVVSSVLSGLCAPLTKEAKTATEARRVGLEALLRWMAIGKRCGGSGKGYDEALAFVRKPVGLKNGSDSQFVLGGLMKEVHPDLLESIVKDLWKEDKFVKGLEGLIEAANKKHNSSSSIPQVEGLLAVYFSLLKACGSPKPKLSAAVEKAVSAGSASLEKTSFVYGEATIKAIATNPIVAEVLPRIIALNTKLSSAAGTLKSKVKATSAVSRALAGCVAHPVSSGKMNPVESMEATLKSILDYQPIGEALAEALFLHVNRLSLDEEQQREALSQKYWEDDCPTLTIKGKGCDNGSHGGMDVNSVRRIAYKLASCPLSPRCLGMVLVLMHTGSSLRDTGSQRKALVSYSTSILTDVVSKAGDELDSTKSAIAELLVQQTRGGTPKDEDGNCADRVSYILHDGTLSLVVSLGGIACEFSPAADDPNSDDKKPYAFASNLCIQELAPRLAEQLGALVPKIESLAEFDVEIFLSRKGTLTKQQNSTKNEAKKDSGKGRRTEDEEWELQMKKEMAQKNKAESTANTVLSAEDKKIVQEQDGERKRISGLVETHKRLLSVVNSLAQSDIEVGNTCLPFLSKDVLTLAVSDCPAMRRIPRLKERSRSSLCTLATCVYEIEETYASMMALALMTCYRPPEKTGETPGPSSKPSEGLTLSPFPSPCEPAAETIFEMDEFQEELSAASFAFLFPVVKAALMGPRTTPGCEGALRVLERHTILLVGEQKDPIVASLRTEMVASVLELLKHDRAQAFVDPSPYDTLIACYQADDATNSSGPALTTAELAALLDDRGALGPKNCRTASMIALGSIASNHKKIVKSNPLIENRIWLNCFEKDDTVRKEARRTWGIIHDSPGLEDANESTSIPPPSPMYAIPLIPLLNNEEKTVAAAAAEAFAKGMESHPNSVQRNIQKLCSSYIDSCPRLGGEETKSTSSLPALPSHKPVAAAPKKKPMGVPASLKKKTVKKSALQVAGIGQAKKSKKKSSAVTKALMKPKQERTLDQAALESQFKTGPQKAPPEKDTPEKAASRRGILNALAALTKCKVAMDTNALKMLTGFLMAYGIADADEGIKNASRNTLRDVVASYGSSDDAIAFFLPHFDKILQSGKAETDVLGDLPTDRIPEGTVALDGRKEGAVVGLGSIALHLKGPENASKIDTTVDMLLNSLKTPNEDVQASVADCLAKLMKKGNTQQRIEGILDGLINSCLEGDNSAARRGGAYGVSAAVKGSGIAALKKFGVVTRLEEACADGSSGNKEGSLFAIELLCTRLGLLFEPYVIVLLPSLLKCFSDGSDHVRKAASNAVGLIMSKLSAHGVKLVMPAVLTAFNDAAWRTKQASIHMLGSMCHLAPKQLAQALPKVVPKLTEAFTDTHPKVKASAQEALNEITTVIRNPEISSLSSELLEALTDPAEKTVGALEALITTEFLHAIDAPSLALIVPILHRGLRDRAATTKRYGALITGNICTMINDPRDFIPYLPTLIPDLQTILLDPIPDVRSISAKAFGSLTRGLGEDALPDLRPWLVERLRDENANSAERSGAAQGLTEVLIASGTATAESVVLDDILPLKDHPSPSTREGVLWMLTYLPPALGQGFTPMLDSCLPALISGLSDENEEVREIGMRAGRVMIKSHGRGHYPKILPILQNGMADVDHRIRLSSLMLVGDLLSMIGGTTVLRTDGNTADDVRKAERAHAQLTLTLGMETKNRILSEVYLARSDSAVAVRQIAIQVWKTVVSVTARTLKQVLPFLVTRVVTDLASGDAEKTEMAGKCLGDIVSKLGDSVMVEIIPVLRDSLYDGDTFTRRGVCVGLSEVIGSSTKDQILRYIDIVVKVVQDALCDDDESVREMAATSFQKLHSLVGNRAMDEVVPALMVALESSEDDDERRTRALNGLTGILSFRSRDLLPYIIPRLIQEPITTNHAKALGSIASVTGDTIYYHFKSIIPALTNDLSFPPDDDKDRENEVRDCVRSIFANSDEAGVNWLIGEIASKCNSDKTEVRRESCWMMETIVLERKEAADFYEQIPIIIRELINRLNDESSPVLKANQKALSALTKHVPAEELVNHVEFMRNLIASMVSDARRRKGGVGDGEFLLPGFNMPKGLEPLLPIYQRGILYGTPSIREASAAGLGEVISLTATKFLAGPLIIKMTGPLLRIVGDRNPSNVKVAILKTLGLILVKGGPALRAFVPQFQTTFVKALADPSRQVRVEAINALGLLMPLSTRVDPLLKELVAGSLGKTAATADSVGTVVVQTATLEALAVVLDKGGKKAKLPDSIPSALNASKELIEHSDEGVRESAAKVMGAACNILGLDVTTDVVEETVLGGKDGSAAIRHGKACAIRRIFTADVSKELDESLSLELRNVAFEYTKDDKEAVKDAGCVAIGAAIARAEDPTSALREVEKDLLSIMENKKERMETHQSMAKGLLLALELSGVEDKVEYFGLTLLNATLKLALSGNQRIQFAYNDVLYSALDVADGPDGLENFSSKAMFEDAKQMKSVYNKVLLKIKGLTLLDD